MLSTCLFVRCNNLVITHGVPQHGGRDDASDVRRGAAARHIL